MKDVPQQAIAMSESEFISLLTACRSEDRAGLLNQIRASVTARRVEHRQ
jgi:hypothetical protein